MHPRPEELAKRLIAGFERADFGNRVMDAYKIFASNRRAFDAAFFGASPEPAHPDTIAAFKKKAARFKQRIATGNAARNALAKPLPFERPMRDVLLKPVALDEPL
jgi:hypothetical protein